MSTENTNETTNLFLCENCHKRPRMGRIFLVCEECWTEVHKDEAPLMPWEL